MRLKDTLGISYYLRNAEHVTRLAIEIELKKLKLSLPMYSTLAIAEELKKFTSSELARSSGVTPQTMMRLVNGLKKMGLMREVGNEGLKVYFELTPKAYKLICQAHEVVNLVERKLVSDLTDKQIDQLKSILQKAFKILAL